MADYSAERDWTYPENYVFRQWGDSRFYNYFVNGRADSYGFARSNYAQFVTTTDPKGWYERLRGRVGFIVVTDAVVSNRSTLGTNLYRGDGGETQTMDGLSHYRLVYASPNERFKLFTLTPGATIDGQTRQSGLISVTTTVSVGNDTFDYEQTVKTDENGNFSVVVPYPGEYEVNGNRRVSITESAVVNGTTVTVGRQPKETAHGRYKLSSDRQVEWFWPAASVGTHSA